MIARKIYESPDTIALPDLRYNSHGEDQDSNRWAPAFGDAHSYPFWYETDEFVMGNEHGGHPNSIRNYKESYSGRVWADRKMISFWIYPSEFTFKDIAKELSERLSKKGYEADILKDPEWKVEILPFGTWRDHQGPFNSELVSASKYKGSGQRSAKDLGQEHSKTPMDPTKKSPPKYIKRKTVWDRMKESKLVPESLDQLFEFERGQGALKGTGVGLEAAKTKLKDSIDWEFSDSEYRGPGNLRFSNWKLHDIWKSASELEKYAIKEVMIEFLSGKKKWRQGNLDSDVLEILNDLGLLWEPEYMVPTPSTTEGIQYAGLDGQEFEDFVSKYWKPNQIYSLGVALRDGDRMKEGIKMGATNLGIGGTEVFEVPLRNDDGELLQLLLDKSETDPGELFTVKTGDFYGRSERTERDESNKALRMAARHGKINTFKVLFNDKRSDPSATNNFALKWAWKMGYDEIVDLLLRDERVQKKLHLLPIGIQKEMREMELMESVKFERGLSPKKAMNVGISKGNPITCPHCEYEGLHKIDQEKLRLGKNTMLFNCPKCSAPFQANIILKENVKFERGQDPKTSMNIGLNAKIMNFLNWVKNDFQLDKNNTGEYMGFINLGDDMFSDKELELREGHRLFVDNYERYLPIMKEMGLYMLEPPWPKEEDYCETIIYDDIVFTPQYSKYRNDIMESANFERGKTPGESMGIGKHSKDLKVYRCGYCGQPTDEYGRPHEYGSEEFNRITDIIDELNDTTTELTHGDCCANEAAAEAQADQAEYEAEAQEELRRQEDDYNDDGYY